jgi:nucleotide-binding universal stress UspA family protein
MSAPANASELTALLPLDGSRLAEAALVVADSLAARFRLKLHLVHAIERKAPERIHGDRHLIRVPEAEEYLRGIAERYKDRAAHVSLHVHEEQQKDVARSIVEHADEIAADLVVMCSHGSGGVRDLLFGSIAQQTLRKGRRPILLVQPKENQDIAFDLRRILLPMDGTGRHDQALQPALRLAAAYSAELRLAMVLPIVASLHGDARSGKTLPTTMRTLLDLQEKEAADYLDQIVGRCRTSGAAAVGQILRGPTVASVCQLAAEWQADLIVIASHARSGLDALFEGSVAPRLTGRLACPMLLIRALET